MPRDSFEYPPPARAWGEVTNLFVRLEVIKDTPNIVNGTYEYYVPDTAGGDPELRTGDLDTHLTTGQRTAIANLLGQLIDKANGA